MVKYLVGIFPKKFLFFLLFVLVFLFSSSFLVFLGPYTSSYAQNHSVVVERDELRRKSMIGDILAVDYLEGGSCDLPLPLDGDRPLSYDHVALVVETGEHLWLVEAEKSEGVRKVSAEEFFDRRSSCDIARLALLRVDVSRNVAREAVRVAKEMVGGKYCGPVELVAGGKGRLDGSYYCSELVWLAYQIGWFRHRDRSGYYRFGSKCHNFLDADEENDIARGDACR